MSLEPKEIESLTIEVEEIGRLLKSNEWRHWLKFLQQDRRAYLQNEVNTALSQGEVLKAQIALALMKDVDKQIALFRKKFSDAESKLRGNK